MKDTIIQWHPAFVAAMQIDLAANTGHLTFEPEYQLTKKPMQIDVLIVKKDADIPIVSKVGHIFKIHNIIEYKSPDDYLSINDFSKVYAYAYTYQSATGTVNEIPLESITITFALYHWPQRVLCHLAKKRNIHPKKYAPGIYYLKGDEFDMQILMIPELDKEENYWLQSLRNNLDTSGELQTYIERSAENQASELHQAVAYTVVKANSIERKENTDMLQIIREIMDEHPDAFPEYANMKAAEERGRNLERENTQRAREQAEYEKESAQRAKEQADHERKSAQRAKEQAKHEKLRADQAEEELIHYKKEVQRLKALLASK